MSTQAWDSDAQARKKMKLDTCLLTRYTSLLHVVIHMNISFFVFDVSQRWWVGFGRRCTGFTIIVGNVHLYLSHVKAALLIRVAGKTNVLKKMLPASSSGSILCNNI